MKTECPICRSGSLSGWDKRAGYQLFRCNRCSHVFADVPPDSFEVMEPDRFREQMTNGYMGNADAYYRHLVKGEAPGRHTWLTAQSILEQAGIPKAGNRWLDIGCGSGFLVSAACERGWDATGIEPGEWGQIAAREKNIRVIHGFLTEETFGPEEKFDVISATDVIEHQSNPIHLLKLARRHLKPGGRMFISIPTADGLQARLFRAKWEMVQLPTHQQFFTKRSFNTMLDLAGFKMIGNVRFNYSEIPYLHPRFPRLNRAAMELLDRFALGDQVIFTIAPSRNSDQPLAGVVEGRFTGRAERDA